MNLVTFIDDHEMEHVIPADKIIELRNLYGPEEGDFQSWVVNWNGTLIPICEAGGTRDREDAFQNVLDQMRGTA